MPGKTNKPSNDEGLARANLPIGEDDQAILNGQMHELAMGEVIWGTDDAQGFSSQEETTQGSFAQEGRALSLDAGTASGESTAEIIEPSSESLVSTASPFHAQETVDAEQAPELEKQGEAGVFPLEIAHEIEVTSEEAIATGWTNEASLAEKQAGISMFPVEIHNGNTIIGPEIVGEAQPGALELVSHPDASFEDETEKASGSVEALIHPLTPAEHDSEATPGTVERISSSAVPVERRSEEIIDAVELVAHGATASEPEPGEIIGPIELVQFMTETEAASTDNVDAVIAETAQTAQVSERRHVVKSAALVSIGNLGSSVMGMVRQIVVTWLGKSFAGPFNAALTPANSFYQLLINGSVSGALVPTFNDYAAPEKREEMRRVVFTVVNLILLLALLASVGYLLIAPWFVDFLVQGYKNQADKVLTLQYSQIIFFSLMALGPFAVLLSALFALKEFGWPAFATAAYHVGIILGAIGLSLFGSFFLGKMALPAGVLLGALGEIALLFPGIRRQRFYYLFVLDLKHPALRRIIKLYLPILVSYAFSTALVFLDVSLWTRAGGDGTANTVAQSNGTVLLQFPVGLVAMALGFAVLPTLTEHAREGNDERFKATLLMGVRVGLLLMIPAMVGMWVLRFPIVDLLFSHRHNGSGLADATLSAIALQNYVYQLPFVAVDQLLIAAFYARKNTLTPVVVGIVCIGFYLLVALPFFQTLGIGALAFANTVQNSMHAVILLILLRRAMGSLHVRQAIPAILKICVAAAVMGGVAWITMDLLGHISFFSLDHLIGQILTVLIAGGLAAAVYVGGILLFKVEEINLVKGAVLAKLGKR